MSLKVEIETWASAIKAYEEKDFLKAIRLFEGIADTSKILTNIGLIQATIGEHDKAVDSFNAATFRDPHLAIAYFQCGVSNFLLKRYDMAYEDFRVTLTHLRGNNFINYEQLGLDFRLYAAEVLFNRGLCRIYQDRLEEGLADLRAANEAKETEDQSVIEEAIADLGEGYTVFSIPVGKLYKPSESKLKSTQTKDYMGKAKLIAAADAKDAYTTFVGSTRLQQGLTPSGAPLNERPPVPDAKISAPMDKPVATNGALSRSLTTTARSGRSDKGDLPPSSFNPDLPLSNGSSGLSRSRTASEANLAQRANPPTANVPPFGTPVRGLSVRRPTTADSAGRASPMPPPPDRRESPPQQGQPARRPTLRTVGRSATVDSSVVTSPIRREPQRGPQSRSREPSRSRTNTQFYDEYLDAYGGVSDEPIPQDLVMRGLNLGGGPGGGGTAERVAAWASNTTLGATPNIPPSRAPSQRTTGGSVTGGEDLYGNQALRRKLSRKPTNSGLRRSRNEDEETRASGDYDDVGFESLKIRVKMHYADDVRGMALTPETTFEEFMDKVALKFGKRYGELAMKFTDEDGGKISLRDDMDFELAIETAKAGSKSSTGKIEGRLEVWLFD